MSTRRTLRTFLILVATATAAAFAATSGASQTGLDHAGPSGTIRFAIEDSPSGMTPWYDGDTNIIRQVYETLVVNRVDAEGQPTGTVLPWLATKWTQTAKRLTMTLRSGVAFQDGTPFDAQAVKVNVAAFKKSASSAGDLLKPIRSVRVEGAHTVVFELSRPAPELLTSLTWFFIASPKALATGKINTEPVGTGAWEYDAQDSTPGSKVVTTYFDGYWNPKIVHVQRIETQGIGDAAARFSAVRTGEVDVADLERDLVDQARGEGYGITTAPALSYQFVFTKRKGVLSDVRVRQAICHAIDSKGIASLLPQGMARVTNQRFTKGIYGYNPSIPNWTYDIAKAKELMKAAGNPKVDLTIAAQPGSRDRTEAIVNSLKQIGVNLELKLLPSSQYFDVWQNYDVGYRNASGEDSPFAYYSDFLAKNGAYNTAHVVLPKVEALVKKALQQPTSAAAAPMWRQVAMQIHKEATACADMKLMENLVYKKDHVTNVKYFGTDTDWHAIRVK